MKLTLLCVTAYERHSTRFLDAHEHLAGRLGAEFVEFDGRGARCVENILDDAIVTLDDGYVLRLDDDELASDSMGDWLASGHWIEFDHWAFPRANLYPDETSFIASEPLWPDLQTRLSVKGKAGGRAGVHAGSPHGTGRIAPCVLEHHKLLARSYEDRLRIANGYETLGAAPYYRVFSLPEDFPVDVKPYEALVAA